MSNIQQNININNPPHMAVSEGSQDQLIDAEQPANIVASSAVLNPIHDQHIANTEIDLRNIQEEQNRDDIDNLILLYQDDIALEEDKFYNGYVLAFINKDISHEKIQEILSNFSAIKDIRTLSLDDCVNLRSLDVVKNFTNLSWLFLSNCVGISNFDNFPELPNLKELSLSECVNLQNLDFLKNVPNLETLSLEGCDDIGSLDSLKNLPKLNELFLSDCSWLQNLNSIPPLHNLRKLNLSNCSNLQSLNGIENFSNLEILDLYKCVGLQTLTFLSFLQKIKELHLFGCSRAEGYIDLNTMTMLKSVDARCTHFHLTIEIHPDSPFSLTERARTSPFVIKNQSSIYDKYISILSNTDEQNIVKGIIQQVRSNELFDDEQKKDFEYNIKSYCERHANDSEIDRAKTEAKYMVALKNFSAYLDACKDRFATGLAKLKIELGLGELLKTCKTTEERRQVLFGIYAQEQIELALARFNEQLRQLGNQSIRELLELQLAFNIIFNTPHSSNMAYDACAYDVAEIISCMHLINSNAFDEFINLGDRFLTNNDGMWQLIEDMLTRNFCRYDNQADEFCLLTPDEAQEFIVPLAIVLTSMLQDEGVSGQFADRKFNTFLLSEQEYWEYATGISGTTLTVDQLESITGETDDSRAIKQLVEEHKDELIDPDGFDESLKDKKLGDAPTLANAFAIMENNDMYSDDLYTKLADIISPKGIASLQNQALIDMYSGNNYEQRLAEHLIKALQSQPQQGHVNPPQTDEQMAERLQLEEYMQAPGDEN